MTRRKSDYVFGMLLAAWETEDQEPVTPHRVNAFENWEDEEVHEQLEELVARDLATRDGDKYEPTQEHL